MEQLSLLPDVAQPLRRPVEPIARAAAIDGNMRWTLHRRWGEGPTVAWGMLNPSDADGLRDDPTLWRIMGFSLRLGFGGLVVGNRYPFRSPSPADLRAWWAQHPSETADAYQRNQCEVGRAFAAADFHIAAWGNSDPDPDQAPFWLEAVANEAGREFAWHCMGTNKDGTPKHPLARGVHRIADDFKPVLWKP